MPVKESLASRLWLESLGLDNIIKLFQIKTSSIWREELIAIKIIKLKKKIIKDNLKLFWKIKIALVNWRSPINQDLFHNFRNKEYLPSLKSLKTVLASELSWNDTKKVSRITSSVLDGKSHQPSKTVYLQRRINGLKKKIRLSKLVQKKWYVLEMNLIFTELLALLNHSVNHSVASNPQKTLCSNINLTKKTNTILVSKTRFMGIGTVIDRILVTFNLDNLRAPEIYL